MRKKRWLYVIMLAVLLLPFLEVKPTQAEESQSIYLPFVTNPAIPTFGVEIINFSTLPQAKEAGNYWVRNNALLWSDVQPDNHNQWIWANVANLEQKLIDTSKAGMETILIIRSTPVWAQKDHRGFCGPMAEGNFADFANFMRGVVQRYSSPPYNVRYYEIWNEPEAPYEENPASPYGCWADPTDTYNGGGYYGEMLKVVYPAIKNTNPHAQVVLGGLLLACDPRNPKEVGYCPTDEDAIQPRFFEGILKASAGNSFDVISFHAFNHYHPDRYAIQSEILMSGWSANGGIVEGKLDYLNKLQAEYGIAKPYLLTEAGLLTAGDSTPAFETAKAEYLVWLYARNLAEGIKGTTWHTFDLGGFRNVAMLGKNQTPLPAYHAYQFITTMLDKATFKKELDLGAGIFGFEFFSQHRIWVLFSEDGGKKSITIPAQFSQAYDLFGEPIPVTVGQASISFDAPIYLEFTN